jgi:protein O-mannose beta-1,4-N-acetylglucosaminyltransferase
MPLFGGIAHLTEQEQQIIRSNTGIPKHTCCDNPYWLYRIYQDTLVNVDEIITLLHQALEDSKQQLNASRFKNPEHATFPPSLIPMEDLHCVTSHDKPPGTLWLSWKEPWNGVKVDKWAIRIEESGQEYITTKRTLAVEGFRPNQQIFFTIRGVVGNLEQITTRAVCVV